MWYDIIILRYNGGGNMTKNVTLHGVAVEDWITEDSLLLIESWSRDGYTMQDIANRIGIKPNTLANWRDKYPELQTAMSNGRELTDYKVENALLKSALGYSTREVKVTTTMRYGKVVETIKETLDKEIAPNVSAIQMWLYNRNKNKWKNMNNAKSVFDEMEEDSSIEITVKRADKDETKNGNAPSSVSEDEEKEIVVRKRSKEETDEVEEKKRRKRIEEEKAKAVNTVVDDDTESDEEWPSEWEEEEDEDN